MPVSLTNPITYVDLAIPVGTIVVSSLHLPPSGFLICDGFSISRTAYGNLFNSIVPSKGAIIITIASGLITLNNHRFLTGESIFITTTGTLPTNLTANRLYYIINVDVNTFRLATTYANAVATSPTPINISGTQSGIHTLFYCPYGIINNQSSTFNLPDLRNATIRGRGESTGFTQNGTTRLGFLESDAFGSHNHGGGSHSHSYNDNEMTAYASPLATGGSWGPINATYNTSNSGTIISTQGENETRMKNQGVNFFIKF